MTDDPLPRNLAAEPIPPSVVPTVAPDQRCVGCGYNLVSLEIDADCPECGTPIRASLRGDLLRFSAPSHVADLLRGAAMLRFAVFAAVLMAFVALVTVLQPTAGLSFAGRALWGTLVMLVGVCGAAAWWGGWWRLTRADPGRRAGAEPLALFVRLAVGLQAVPLMLMCVALAMDGMGQLGVETLAVCLLLLTAASVPQFVLGCFFLARLSRRLPEPRISETAPRLVGGTAVAAVALIVGQSPQPLSVLMALGGSFGLLLCAAGYAGLIFRLHGRLVEEHAAARRNAAAPAL